MKTVKMLVNCVLSFVILLAILSIDVNGHTLSRVKRQIFDFSNNTPPPNTSNCVQNNCVIPNYCKNGGTCNYDNFKCEARCKCQPNFSGTRCRTNMLATTMPTGCTRNPCQGLGFSLCAGNATCQMNNTTCKPECLCPEGFTGNSCETEIIPEHNATTMSQGSTTTLRPKAERQCAPGFLCRQGICNQELLAIGRFQCICDPGYIGTHCTARCGRDCGLYGECYLNVTEFNCSCLPDWVGENCTEPKPPPATVEPPTDTDWVWWVVGSCIVLLVILVLLLVVFPLWLWKRREIFIMKIVHYFQPYEDSDGKLFDAFVSYKSHPDDEEFVLKKVYQTLENELGFKLCLHFRDFQVGETITNNILWAVENSRRTVLIISPNYLGSEFARFEYQTAHLETLRLQQRIIPIVYKDVSNHKQDIDHTLKNIMNTITYLEWPELKDEKKETKFWKRLVLSMPKRKDIEKSKELNPTSPSKLPVVPNSKGVNLLSYTSLNGKKTESVTWTNISLDDSAKTDTDVTIKQDDIGVQINNHKEPQLA